MKLNTFYSAQKIVKELEQIQTITKKFENGQRTVTLNLANMTPILKRELQATFKDLEARLEAELEKLK